MLIFWDIFEIKSDEDTLHGVKLRGRIRKFCIEREITCLVENASDAENVVRFAIPVGAKEQEIVATLKTLLPQAEVTKVLGDTPNPVLSKLKVNDLSRYE